MNQVLPENRLTSWGRNVVLLIVGFVLGVVLAIFLGPFFQSQIANEVGLLYVQTADSGSLTPTDADGVWRLTLNDVSPDTVYFSDRPARETGRESTENFIASWGEGENSFADTPPNAALDITNSDGDQTVLVLELMNADYSPDTATVIYEVIILDGDPTHDVVDGLSFGAAALFIDSTYKHYTCDCEIKGGGDTCTCRYEYNLKPSASKEFRVTCKNTTYTDIGIADRRKDTTCTTHFMTKSFGGNYTSKTCTNWSPTANDNVTVKAICTEDDPRWPGDD